MVINTGMVSLAITLTGRQIRRNDGNGAHACLTEAAGGGDKQEDAGNQQEFHLRFTGKGYSADSFGWKATSQKERQKVSI